MRAGSSNRPADDGVRVAVIFHFYLTSAGVLLRHESHIPRVADRLVSGDRRPGGGDPPDGSRCMNWNYLMSGLLALMLFVYLLYALLKAEKF